MISDAHISSCSPHVPSPCLAERPHGPPPTTPAACTELDPEARPSLRHRGPSTEQPRIFAADLHINPGNTRGKPHRPPAGTPHNHDSPRQPVPARNVPHQPAPTRISPRCHASARGITRNACSACGDVFSRISHIVMHMRLNHEIYDLIMRDMYVNSFVTFTSQYTN